MSLAAKLSTPGMLALYGVTGVVTWGVWYVHRGQKIEKEVRRFCAGIVESAMLAAGSGCGGSSGWQCKCLWVGIWQAAAG